MKLPRRRLAPGLKGAAISMAALLGAGCVSLSSQFPGYQGLDRGRWSAPEIPAQTPAQRQAERQWLGLLQEPRLAQEQGQTQARPVDWGIAMSGGGLRSALYNLGAMKALYDAGVLGRADYLSAVSGGGYTLYWMYWLDEELGKPGEPFGASAFDDRHFMRQVCEISKSADFVSYSKILKLFGGSTSRKAREIYQRAILRTFGRQELADDAPLEAVLPLAGLENRGGSRPLPIVNATINDIEGLGTWRQRLFEFTPLHLGNDKLGHSGWERHVGEAPGWYRLAAMSGAAHEVLTDAIRLHGDEGKTLTVPLFDGGKSENLGAVALIRRGVPNIVIIDAEHDPAHQFGGYVRLRDQLKSSYGLHLAIPGIDRGYFPSFRADWGSSAFVGAVHNAAGEKVSTVYYQKMAVSRPVSMQFDHFGDASSDGAKQREIYAREYLAQDCNGTTAIDLAIWAAYAGGSYKGYLESKRFWTRVANAFPGRGLKNHFPHYTTADQSFYLDQAEAFVGIGYLNGLELVAKLEE